MNKEFKMKTKTKLVDLHVESFVTSEKRQIEGGVTIFATSSVTCANAIARVTIAAIGAIAVAIDDD